ncbi:MAG TPA: T9SS type A sorting domain-containing protein [Cyclobacteriaceae bacterium]|nr:T9SS type A sorting domain-containing protein [Cyclobacteriaceae bacterium]HNU40963.1 T9SS type A sorting domain-containing protein [Cyclobacteriaceae bacterium]
MLPVSAQTHQVFTSPDGTNFWLYTPVGYSAGTPAPMLVSLHGLGQIADPVKGIDINTLVLQSSDATPAYLIHHNKWNTSHPFIVVSPQLKADGNGVEQDYTAAFIDEIVEHVKTLRTIDTNRIYFTGLSLGGQGSMIYAMAHPDKVTAMVTMANRTNEIIQDACNLVGKPLWMFHGTDDIVYYSNSVDMLNAIISCVPTPTITPHLTTVHAGRHDIWNAVYTLTAGFDIYNWLLQFSLADNSNKPPSVFAGSNKKFLTQEGTVYLHGDAFDIDGTVTSVQWTKVSGPAVTLENANTLILSITNLQPGTFTFRLTATDNLGQQRSDDITVTLAASTTEHTVTGLTLYNGLTNAPIGALTDGMVINKYLLGVQEFNVLATTNKPGAGSSHVIFRINEHQFVRSAGVYYPATTFVFTPQTSPNKEWQILPGAYTFCGAAITGNPLPPALTITENFSKCVRFTVFDQPIKQFYAQAGEDVSLLTSWGSNPDGSGDPPESFTGAFQVFNVQAAVQQNQALTIGGIESYLWVRAGGELTLNNNFTGAINLEGNGVVHVNTSQPVIFGSVSPASTVWFGTNATSIPAAAYGHVVIAGSVKTLPEGNLALAGNLQIEAGAGLSGSLSGTSTITLAGNLQIAGALNPERKFNLHFKESLSHTLLLGGLSSFNELMVKTGASVSVSGTTARVLELGTSSGGGLTIEDNGELLLANHTLSISGQGVITCNQNGQVGFSKGAVTYNSQSTTPSSLRVKTNADSIQVLRVNGSTNSQLTVANRLYVLDSMQVVQGNLHSNNIILVSTAEKTARIAAFTGSGTLTGPIGFQRYIRPGRMYRYLAFPVAGVMVDSLQEYLPVTGNFLGASKGAGLATATPSLFQFENNAWAPFPTTDSAAQFTLGRGYSVFMRHENEPLTIQVNGEIHRGDFDFQLSADTIWNLLGNPYAAPIQWNTTWTASGVGTSVYVRDNEQGNGRFQVWDGQTGDVEFSGNIAPGQSFWIKGEVPNPSLRVSEPSKVASGIFFKTHNNAPQVISVSLTHGSISDKAYLKYNNGASTKFDIHTDARKLKNTFHNLSILTTDSVSASIKSMPDSCETMVGLRLEDVTPGTYTLNFKGDFDPVRTFQVKDLFTDSVISVRSPASYEFEVTEQPASFGKSRFQFITKNSLPEPVILIKGDTLFSNAATENQWYLNGQAIAGGTQPFWIARQTGVYQVETRALSCIKKSAPLSFVITGANSPEPLTIYPNPASGSVIVQGISDITPFVIHDLNGKPVHTGMLSATQNQVEFSLPAGVYILSVDKKSRHTKLIIR